MEAVIEDDDDDASFAMVSGPGSVMSMSLILLIVSRCHFVARAATSTPEDEHAAGAALKIAKHDLEPSHVLSSRSL
jgi:hypothetical protein